jgi:hypothetical protein
MIKFNLYKLLLTVSIIILIIVIYNYIITVYPLKYSLEYFSNPFKKKKKKTNFTLEEEYKIKKKKLDEKQTLQVWDIPWIKKNKDNRLLKKLWKKLKVIYP